MIGVLRPQTTPSGSNNPSRESGSLVQGSRRETKTTNTPAQRYLAPDGCDDARHLATYALAEDPAGDDASVTASTSPRLIGGHSSDVYSTRGDKRAPPQLRPARLAVAVVQSTSDGHQVKALDNRAEVGTICVAVAHQALNRASHTHLGTAGPGESMLNTNLSAFGATGLSPLSASAGTLRKIVRRCAQLFAPRAAGREAHGSEEACLVLYCKLPGGVIMASPLDGPAFRLRKDVGAVEGKRSVGREATDGAQQKSWTLPAEGFEALCDLEDSVAPGLPTLAREMARDGNCVANESGGATRPLAEEISLRISGDNEDRQSYVVIPRVAGIVFARLGPAGPRAVTGGHASDVGSSGRACVRASVVMARLEREDGGTGTLAVRHRYVLEELDVFRGDGDFRDCSRAVNTERASAKKITRRYLSLPVAYADLLEEATSPSPSPGGKFFSSRICSRWRRRHKHRAGANQVVPDVGEDIGFEDERGKRLLGPEQPVREDRRAAGSRKPSQREPPSATAPRAGGVSTRYQPEEPQELALTVRGVQAASLDQAIRWASTREVVWAVLAAACRPEDGGCRTAAETRGDAAQTTAVCAAGAARALLARVFGNGTPDRGTARISDKEAPIVLGRWWEGFCAAAAPFCCDDGGGQGTLPLLREAPRFLLEGMLEIPAVETAFLERGLVRHLADVLHLALVQMKSAREEEELCDHHSTGYPCTGNASPCGMTNLPDGDANASGPSHGTIGAIIRPIKEEGGASSSPEADPRDQRLPWWLIFHQRRGKACCRHSDHAFEDALKTGGGSADGGSTGRSCRMVSGDSKGERVGRGPDTSRKDDANDCLNVAAGNDSLGSESVPTPSVSEHREREGIVQRRTGHGTDVVAHRERISPPMLRLDALDSILATKEWGSPRGSSQRAAVTLSTASTRAAPEHLPTFLSARGATSRASARHGSGCSLRTGRTTQRDWTASTGCPTVRSVSPTVVTDVDAAASCPLPLPLPQPLLSNDRDPVRGDDGRGGEEVGSGGSDGGGDGERCGASGDEMCLGGGGGVVVGTRAASGGGSIPPAVEQAPGKTDGSGIIEDDDGNLLHNSDTADTVVPATHGGGYVSVRKEMPRLSLEELPVTRTAAEATSVAVDRDSPCTSGTTFARVSPRASPASPKQSPAPGYAEHSTEPGGGYLVLSPPVVDGGRGYSARHSPHQATQNGALEQVDRTPDCRPGSTPSATAITGDTFEGPSDGVRSQNHPPAVENSDRVDHGSLRALPTYDSPVTLVVDLARGSALVFAPLSRPSRAQQKRQATAHVFGAAVAIAKMLLSLLPSTPAERDPEDRLVAALEVLSFVGALSWTDGNAWATAPVTTTCGSKPAVVGHARRIDAGPHDTRREPSVWPLELDNVGIALLSRAGEVHLDRRLSVLRVQCQRTDHDECGEEMTSQSHRSHVHNACRLGLECGWMTRLFLRRVLAAGAFNSEWRSVLSAEQSVDALRFCGRAFEMLQRGLRCTCSSGASYDIGRSDDNHEVQEDSAEMAQRCSGHAEESLLLTAPAAVDLARLVVVLVRQPVAWGENPAWAALTLGSAASRRDGEGAIVPVLVELLNQLISVTSTEDGDASQGVGAEAGQHWRQAHGGHTLLEGAQALERRLTGGGDVMDELLFSLLGSSAAIVRRAGTLLETLQETSDSAVPERVDKDEKEISKAAALVAREMAPIFRPDGLILKMMTTPLQSGSSIEEATDTSATVPTKQPDVGSPIPSPCLAAAAAVRLSAAYFSLYGRTPSREEQDLVRLEAFVDPLFSRFRKECEALLGQSQPEGSHEAPPSERVRQAACAARNEPKTEQEGTAARRRGSVLLCRLHLEALVELAAVQDAAVRKRLDDCRVAPFLVERVLGVGGDAAGTTKKSPRPVHGSVENSSCCDATVTSRSSLSRSPSAEHLSSVNGSGITSPTHQVAKTDTAETCGASSSSAVAENATTSLSVGDRVDGLVSVKRGRPRWFPGRVAGMNGDDGTVHVCFDDGDEEIRKDPAELRPSRKRDTERVKGRSRSTLPRPAGGGTAASATQKGGHQLATTKEQSKPRVSSRPTSDVTNSVIPPPATQTKRSDAVAGKECSSHGNRNAPVESGARRSAWAGGDATVATMFEGGGDVPATAIAADDGGIGAAEADSEDDDAYFVIQSVLDDASAVSNNGRPSVAADSAASMSVVPRIDLQSPVFRTRVSSSQLGPGSSLSTPTTGGARILDTVRGAAGSRSEASLSTAVFPSGRSSRVLRPPLFTDRPSAIGGGGSSSRGFSMVRSASVLSDTRPPMADSGGRVTEREITGLLKNDGESSSDEDEEEEEGEEEEERPEKGVPLPEAGNSRSPRQLPQCRRHKVETDNERDAGAGGHPQGAKRMSEEEAVRLRDDDKNNQVLPRVNYENDLSVIQRYAVELLLCMATAPSGHGNSPAWEHILPPTSARGSVEIASLRAFFDSDRNAHIVPSLRSQWHPEVAVLAKLVCTALFDAQSYSLDGDHIGAGRFGGVIVSECPLPLGGGRYHLASAQASSTPSSAGKEDGLESPTRLAESSLSVPPRRSKSGREQGEVALKVIGRDDLDDAVGQNVFLEALALRALADVPGVCRLYDFGVTPTSYVLVLERCACSLNDWRSARSDNDKDDLSTSPCGPRSDAEVALYLAVFRQIVAAVGAMAARGVIHFDLKCDNVLVRGGSSRTEYHECLTSSPTAAGLRTVLAMEQDIVPSVCVTDFGEAIVGRRRRCPPKATDAFPAAAGPDPGSATNGDEFFFDVRGSRGTERIQSPEMVLLSGRGGGTGGGGPSSADPAVGADRGESAGGITTASDVWSLGCLLYELLSMQPLFRDLQWSEFFVTLTAGEVVGGAGNGTVPVAEGASVPPLPPPLSLCPFAALGCAKAVKTLLEAMLVRNPAKRPSALRVVSVVDEALTAVVSSLPVGSEKHPPTTITRPKTKNQSATSLGSPDANTHSMPRGQGDSPGGEHSQVEHQTEVVAHSGRGSGGQATTEAAAGRAPFHPSTTVGALRSFAAKQQSGVLGGKGENLAACPARQQLGSETMVCCNTTVWRDCCVGAAAGGTSALAVDEMAPLGIILPALGISHIVCVNTTYGNPATSKQQQSDSRTPGKKSRILSVSVRTEKDRSREETGGASPPSSAARLVRDVAEFATGPRVLFAGVGGGCGGEAGAVAMAWAMERTGKGAYETMLSFRQACAEFWVETATIKSVLG
ncbi:conserved unknown protein [Ectocarpus siliculosus]|uniref:Protein kinase domain-containing protein n=1 Tax=Ectocarpus siliculosus TaxID=2880 RepID=D7G0M8_ECTSI|nr:conserved unknown protein [Ectocarpus siliculosus]|eukprot:CBJ33057.1 conserved unknown protein [Ectocarpus siliculosus]